MMETFNGSPYPHVWRYYRLENKVTKVIIEPGVKTGTSCSALFYGMQNCTEIDLSGLDTTNATNMSQMFSGCRSLTSIDLSPLNTTNATNMSNMFSGCSSFVELDVSNIVTSNVTNMESMFYGCSQLVTLDLSRFDTSKVTNMKRMFSGLNTGSASPSYVGANNACKSLVSIEGISDWDTSSLTNLSEMFNGCVSLESLDLSKWDVSNVTSFDGVFSSCSSLSNLDVADWDVSNATSLNGLFSGTHSLKTVDIADWDVSNVQNFGSLFATSVEFVGAYNLGTGIEYVDLSSWDTSSATNMAYMFSGCKNLLEVDVSNFNMSNVTSISGMFKYCNKIEVIDVSNWDTSSVTEMYSTFYKCYEVEVLDFSNCDLSSVIHFHGGQEGIFENCTSLKKLDIHTMSNPNIHPASYMFEGCSSLEELDISSMITNTEDFSLERMFYGCVSLKKVHLGNNFSFIGDGSLLNKREYAILNTPPSDFPFTGKWIRDDGAYGPYTPIELVENYDGNIMAGTWVWEQRDPNFIVSYSYTGSVPEGASALPANQTHEYGTEVIVEPDSTAPGYIFSGWSRTGTFTMPAENVEIMGSFTPRTDTIYKVEHYQQNINNNLYTLKETENLTGTTNSTVTATPKNYNGFTFDSSVNGTVQSGTVNANGTLVLKLYYTRNNYQVLYRYNGTVPSGASTLPTTTTYKYGASVTVAGNATAPGYTFSGWSRTGTFTMPAEDVEITGRFTPKTNTPYKIEHYQQNINNDNYTLIETENKTGTTDTTATAIPKTYTGFTFNSGISTTSGSINGNGTLVLKLYYTRNSYNVTYSYTGNVPEGASSLPTDQVHKYGTEVTVESNATAPGYTFSGWNRNGTFTMPAEDVEITGGFTAKTNTPYIIEHYTKDLGTNTYTLKETENKTGTTDTQVTAVAKTYEGFTFDNTINGTVATGTINGNGTLVLKLYYTRNSYEVSYRYTSAPIEAPLLPANQSYEFGESVIVVPDVIVPGYTFSGWSRTGTFTMPAEGVEITGGFTANTNTPYKIEHYTKDIGSNTYTLKETENKTGTTDALVSATPKSYKGFTFDSTIPGTLQSDYIAGDGNLTLKLYYTRNSYEVSYRYTSAPVSASLLPANQTYEFEALVTVAEDSTAPGYTFSGWSRTGTFTMPAVDVEITGGFTANTNTSYKIEHYTKDVGSNTYTLKETENKTGTTDALVSATPKSYEGFTFDSTIPGTLQSDYIAGDGNLTLKLYYTRNSYEVSYRYTSAPVSASLLPANQTYEYEALVTVAEDSTAPGYTFNGWSRTGTFTMPAEDIEITGGFTANTNTSYKIEHYTKDVGSNTYTLKETENKTGTTDAIVSATPKSYEGFTFDSTIPGTLQSDYIAGNGNLTLKLYYNRNSYTVSYSYLGTVPSGASTLPANQTYEYEANVTVAPNATAPGYTFNGWNRTGIFTMPAEDVAIKGSFSSNSNTTYKVEHYKENLSSNTFTLFETDTLAGETDTEITASPNTYNGFTFDNSVIGTKESGTITGDGRLVLKLYYTRNSYGVTYSYISAPDTASLLPSYATYEYEEVVTVADDSTAPGYTFNGWSRTGTFSMPAEDIEITGGFTANTNTSYKIEHYIEDVNADTFTLKDTEYKTGTTDTLATATQNTYTGFTFNNSISTTSGNIDGNGNLTLKLYYNRNSYTVSYSYLGTIPNGASTLPENHTYEYEEVVTVAQEATAPGYTFNGWSGTGTFTMPAEDIEITGGFTANTNTSYKIEHYIEDVNADTFTLKDTEYKTGTTDILATATQKTYDGFTYNNSISITSGNIDGNGNLVLKLYYNRNSYTVSYSYQGTIPNGASTLPENHTYEYGETVTVAQEATAPGYTFSGWSRVGTFTMPAEDVEITGSFTANNNTSYRVEHYIEDLNADTFTLKDTEYKTGITDTLATATQNTYTGFTFNNSISTTSGNIDGNGNLVLKLYYNRNSYTISYEYEGIVPAGASSLPPTETLEYEAEIIVAPDSTAPGYTFSGWTRTRSSSMPAQNIVMSGSFTAKSNTPYKVEHYLKDLNSDNYTLKDTENKMGMTDTTATATQNTYTGFTFNNSMSTTSGNIDGNGNLVLKLYYTRNSYQVSYLYTGTVPEGASSLPANQTYEYEAEVTVEPNATAPGYTFSNWSRTGTFIMPAEDVQISGSFIANDNTPYKVEHYLEDLKADTFTLKHTENLSGETDQEVAANVKDYAGFIFDETIIGTKKTGTITADGELILKLYYTRNSYNVSYIYNSAPVTATLLPANQTYEYEEEVNIAPDAEAPGYTFSGWSKTGTFTMPAEDVEINGSFAPNRDTPYIVEHYIEKEDGSYELKESENLVGVTDTNVTALSKQYEGFEFDENNSNNVKSGTITGEGNLILKLYYKKIKCEYKVDYYFDDVLDESLEEIINAELNSEVMANPTTPVKHGEKNYTLVSSNHKITIKINNEENIINVYYETDVLDYNIDNYEDESNGDGIPDKYQIEVKFNVENGRWDDGTIGTKVKAITLLDQNGNPSQDGIGETTIPSVGSNANEGYVVGNWNEEIPNTFTAKDNGKEFTYSYKAEPPKEEAKTDIVDEDKGSSNPKTSDTIQRHLNYGIIGMILLLISLKISKKYSRKAKKIQF